MPKYRIEAPNGKSLELEGDHVPTDAEIQAVFKAKGIETGATPAQTAQIGPAHPGTALPPESGGYSNPIGPNARRVLTSPLIHPTGLDSIDSLTSPTSIVTALIGGGMAANQARMAGPTVSKTLGAMKGVLAQMAPQLKYEVIKSTLQAVGFSPVLATGAALALSGGKHPAANEVVAEAPKSAPAPTAPAAAPVAEPPVNVAELAAKVDPRVAGGAAPTEPTPAPKVSAVGVPDRATAPDASARAATMAEAVKGAEPPKASASASEPVAFDHNAAMQGTRKVFQQVNVKPLPAEISNAAEYMRFAAKRGEVVTPEAAVLREIAKRPGVPSAAIEAMTKKLEAQMEASAALVKKLGTADPAAVDAAVARRNATGAWQR